MQNIIRLAFWLLLCNAATFAGAEEEPLHSPVKETPSDTHPSGDLGAGSVAGNSAPALAGSEPTGGDNLAQPSAGSKPPAKLPLAGAAEGSLHSSGAPTGVPLAGAAEPPTHIQVSYDVLKDNIRAITITETYTRTRNRYHIESVSKAIGLLAVFKPETIRVTSDGVLTAKGLRPLTFTNERKLDTERNTRADFDWASNRITLTDRAGKHTLPLLPGTQDRLSAMYQFMFAPLKNAATLDFHMTNGSKIDDYSYLVTPGQSVAVPLGTFKALYVSSTQKTGDGQTEIWLATEHANFPTR